MGSLPFVPPLEDIRFCLFDQFDMVGSYAGIERFSSFDRDTYDATLDEAARIATDVLHPINAVGDRVGCKLDADGNVTTPPGFREAWTTMAEGGWISVSAPPEVGGVGFPSLMSIAVVEQFIGAAMAFEMYPGLTAAAARVILHHGPPHLREGVGRKMFTGAWSGTMCLTEAGAGSDVGENRCRATPVGDGVFHLEGEKIFISGGDSDVAPNVVHLVLARTPDSAPGTRGLSLFMVSKFDFDDALELGERNGAKVTGIEEKMGIHGSATCTLLLGADRPCKGMLVGNEHQGMELMFLMMNEARIGVGMQGVAIASAATSYAMRYAAERNQGSDAARFRDPLAPRVPISTHADVRRNLMTMKVTSEALRSLLYRLGHRFDLAENDPVRRAALIGRVELLVPVLKSIATDRGFDVAAMGVQVLGGYGYIGEYPLEQLVRDIKIGSIYEGTNGIQALDLLARKMRQNNGALVQEWMTDALADIEIGKAQGFGDEADALGKAVNALGATAMHLGMMAMSGKLDAALVMATPFLNLFGTVQLGLECLDQAAVAKRVITERGPTPHLEGKAHNLRFYVRNLLPHATALAKIIQSGDDTCMAPGALG